MEFALTPLIHRSTIPLALRPAPSTTSTPYIFIIFINKTLEYIGVEIYKAIYKYIQLQGNLNGYRS